MTAFDHWLRENLRLHDADYTTNAPSYYDELARKRQLFELLAKKIWEYDKELAKRFAEWDQLISEFDEDVLNLLRQWMEDGTMEDLINEVLFSRKVDKTYIEGLPLNALELGFIGDGVTDNKAAFAEHFKQGVPVNIFFPPGKYLTSETFHIAADSNIELVGDVTFIGDNFVSGHVIEINQEADESNTHTILNNLSTAAEMKKGSKKLRISQSLQPGDIVAIKDTANGSWYSSRDYYQKGEFLEVSHQVGETVYFKESLKDNYKQTDQIALMYMKTVTIKGKLKVHQKTNKGNADGIRLNLLKNNVYHIESQLDNGNAALQLARCFGIQLKGVAHQKNFLSGSLGYGLVIANSQNILYEGQFSGSRHGVTHGGSPVVGNVVNRNIRGKGTVSSNNLGKSFAFDTHTNSEDIYFEGTINGGASLSGSNLTLKGEIYSDAPRAIYLNGLISLNVDLSGLRIYLPDPADLSSIENTGSIDCQTMVVPETRPGLMNFRDIMIMNQPSRYVIQLNAVDGNNNAVLEKTNFDFSNLILLGNDVSNNSVRMYIPTSAKYGGINLHNVDTEKISIRLAAFKRVLTDVYSFSTDIVVSSSDPYLNRLSRIIEYSTLGIPTIKTTYPTAALNFRPNNLSGVNLIVSSYPISNRITLTIEKADKTDFSIGDTITVWGTIR